LRVVLDARGAVRYRGTGIGTYTYRLAEELAASTGPPDRLLICLPPGSPPLPAEERTTGGQAVFWRLTGDNDQEQSLEIADLCARARADVLHMPQNGRSLPRVGCAVVTTVHDLIPFLLPQTCNPAYLQDCLEQLPWVCRRSEKIIAVSRHTAECLTEVMGVPPGRIAVVHEAPEPAYVAAVPGPEAARVASANGLRTGYVLHVGGFSPRKNLAALVQGLALLHRGRIGGAWMGWQPPDAVLTGKPGRDSDRVSSLARALGVGARIHLPGLVPVEDMPGLYAGAAVVCCPSLEEGFSLPLVEAMAVGAPLAVSDIPVHREVAGGAAVYFDPHRPKQLAESIAGVLADPDLRRYLIACGRERVRRYSWRRAAIETWLVYRWAVVERGLAG